MKKAKGTILWFALCNLVLVVSTFIHEVAHGFSSWLNGYAVSTGFNRVGNAYKFPRDYDFRAGFTGGEVLKDLGQTVTLVLALIFTVIFIRKTYTNSLIDKSILAFAVSNSIIRLVPCITVLFRIVFTGNGAEDEIEQGIALGEYFGLPFLSYTLAILSIVISGVCLWLIYRRFKAIKKSGKSIPNPSWIWPAYITSLVILNFLDMYLRINWVPR